MSHRPRTPGRQRPTRQEGRPADQRDAGLTLIEIIIAMTLSVLLIGVMVAVLITSMNAADSTNSQAHDSLDLSTASAFLYRDAQATNVGVSTSSAQGCTATGTLVGSFKWTDKDTVGNVTTYVAVYTMVANPAPSKTFSLTRTLCTNGGAGSAITVLGQAVATATLTCSSPSNCSTLPSQVALHLVGGGTRNPMDDTLTAAVRTSQVTDITKIGSVVSMLVLGQNGTCPGASVSGTTSLTFNGSGIVSSTCSPQVADANPAQLTSAALTTGVTDPVAAGVAAPPLASCTNSGGNPAVSAQTGSSPLYFPNSFTVSSPTYFPAGQYMFCDGLTVAAGGSIEGSGVFIATKVKNTSNKALTISTTATINATAPTTGTYKNMLFWVSNGSGADLGLNGAVANYGGLVYAPTSVVTLAANASGTTQSLRSNLAGVVGKQIAFSGAGTLQLGAAPLDISISPRTLPSGVAGTAYSQLLTAAGITESGWTSLNLPTGLTIDNSGTISGTPSCSGTFNPEVAAYDGNGLAAGAAYDGHFDRFASQAGVQYGTFAIAPSVTLTNPGTPVKKGITLSATATNCSGTTKVTFQYAPTGTSTWTTACNNQSSATTTFTCTWSPNDGTYDLQAIATDGGLSTTSAKIAGILVDGTAPSVTITSPANNATVSGSVAVTATVTDAGSGVNTVNISIGTATCTAAVISGSSWGCSVDTSSLTPGSFTLTVTASDKVGNSASATENVTVTSAGGSGSCGASTVGPDVQACNGSGKAGLPDAGDKIILVYSAPVKKSTINNKFASTDPLTIDVRFRDNSSKETVDFWMTNNADGDNENGVHLGSIDIGNGQIAKDKTLWFKATMTMDKDGKTIIITLGSIDSGNASDLNTSNAKNDMKWTPDNNVQTVGPPSTSVGNKVVTEGGTSDIDF